MGGGGGGRNSVFSRMSMMNVKTRIFLGWKEKSANRLAAFQSTNMLARLYFRAFTPVVPSAHNALPENQAQLRPSSSSGAGSYVTS